MSSGSGFAGDYLSVEQVINAKSGNVSEQLATITNGDMPTVTIDCTGNQQAINNSLHGILHMEEICIDRFKKLI